jgi:uncharacterized membrane protein YbhN (UPF0104 family)
LLKRPGLKTALAVVKVTVSAGLLAVLFNRADLRTMLTQFRQMNLAWMTAALSMYGLMLLVSAWRWRLLLRIQAVHVRFGILTRSFLVATFFNNFLPSNIGGDVVRVADTAPAAGSKTLATTVILFDRGIGLMGLVLIAALGASSTSRLADGGPVPPIALWAGFAAAMAVLTPALLVPALFARVLRPIRVLHPTWVDERLSRLTGALSRFGKAPGALIGCFGGAIVVQAVLVGFYLAIANSMQIPVGFPELAVIVPITFIVQMLPLSMNGFGVREATFGFYFSRLGLPLESALLVSFMGAALIMLFSLTGAAAYVTRNRREIVQLDASAV